MKTKISLLKFTVVLLFTQFIWTINSEAQQWLQTKGPEWGRIYTVLENGSDILIGNNGGIYSSDDKGENWNKLDIGYQYLGVNKLLKIGSDIYAATSGSGVLISNDDGLTWNASNTGLGNFNINCLYLSGSNLYAGTNDGPYVSTNNGASWAAINTGLTAIPVNAILSFNNILYAGTASGVYLSTNSGNSWFLSNSGIDQINGVHSLSSAGTYVLAGSGIYIYRSSNNGSSWNVVNDKDVNNTFYHKDNKIYAAGIAGIYQSIDDGSTWNSIGYTPQVNDIYFSDNEFYAASMRGMNKSNDGGKIWTGINKGIYCSYVDKVYAPKTGLLLAGENYGYTHTSDNYGWTWLGKESVGFFNLWGQNLYTFASYGNRLFCGTGNGIQVSDNEANTWYGSNSGMLQFNTEYANIRAITVTDNSILAGTSASGLYNGNGVYVSTDNGASWATSNIGGLDGKDVHSLAASGNTVLAGTYKNAIYVSSDKGFTWTQKTNGIGSTFFGGYYTLNALAISKNNFLAGSQSGLYISTDNGDSWAKVSGTLAGENISTLHVVADSVYAVCSQGIFKSVDHGISWNSMNTGLINTSITSLTSDGLCLYAGTNGSGIWRYPFGDPALGNREEALIENELLVYPNPVSEGVSDVKIRSGNKMIKSVEIYNFIGKPVNLNIVRDAVGFSMNTSGLPSGIYFIKIVDANNVTSIQKLIKN